MTNDQIVPVPIDGIHCESKDWQLGHIGLGGNLNLLQFEQL